MKQAKHRLNHVILIITMFMLFPIKVLSAEDNFSVPASAAFAVDFNTGKVLYNQNADEPLGIASMTKLITAYIVYEEVEKGNIAWTDTVPISDKLKKMSKDPDLSNVPIEDDQVYTVKDALDASIISSANSLTSALAEYISGTEIKFVDRMYEQLKSWGITDAYLVTASGLGNEDMGKDIYPGSGKKDENKLSARSMAIVAQHLISDYPEVLDISSQPSTTILKDEEVEIWNSNDMLPGFDYYTEGVDGLKTGTTPLAGACFVGTISRDNQRIITVVMDVEEEYNRFQVTADLMNYTLDNWTYKTISKKGDLSSQKTLPTHYGKQKDVDIILAEDLSVWTKNDNKNIKLFFETDKKQLTKKEQVAAPKEKGYIVGKEYAFNADDKLGYLTKEDEKHDVVDVVLKTNLEKANIFVRFWNYITQR